jgi:hypothetical protein
MPLYDYACSQAHRHTHYYHAYGQAPEVTPCRTCGDPASKCLAAPNTPQFFSESSPQVIATLDPAVTITSPAQHRALMRQHEVEPLTEWHTRKYTQTDGLRTRAPRPHPADMLLRG